MPSATPETIEQYAQALKQDLGAHGHDPENAKYIERISAIAAGALKGQNQRQDH
jgi:hypothetical protein